MILFFDTETTGLVRFDLRYERNEQPRMVQLAFILSDFGGHEIIQFSSIIRPNGFTIPPNMIHGISNEYATEKGIPASLALEMFEFAIRKCTIVVGHNIKFDKVVMNHEFHLSGESEKFGTKNEFCTMLQSTDLCRLPSKNPRGGGSFKWPKLKEAYSILCGKELEGAHNAINDLRATKELYFHLMNATIHDLSNVTT